MSAPSGFTFRLQALLDYRRNLVEEAEQVLARHEQVIVQYQRGVELIGERREQMKLYLGALQVQPSIDIQALESVSGYDRRLDGEARALGRRIREEERAAREARDIVVQRRIDLEAIEKLRERDLERFMAGERAKEDRLLDEFASSAFARNMGAARGLRPSGDAPWKEQELTSRASRSS